MEQQTLKTQQLFEYKHLLLIRDIWCSNLFLNVVHYFNTNVN